MMLFLFFSFLHTAAFDQSSCCLSLLRLSLLIAGVGVCGLDMAFSMAFPPSFLRQARSPGACSAVGLQQRLKVQHQQTLKPVCNFKGGNILQELEQVQERQENAITFAGEILPSVVCLLLPAWSSVWGPHHKDLAVTWPHA